MSSRHLHHHSSGGGGGSGAERTFNVVVHLESTELGGTRLFQGVHARSVDDLVDQLESRLQQGARIVEAHVYSEATDAYQPLHPSDFPHLPGHIELAVKVKLYGVRRTDDWTRGDGGVSFDQRRRSSLPEAGGAGEPDLRRQIVERARVLFLPYFNRQQITKAEMTEACAQLLRRFVHHRAIDQSELASTRRQLSLDEADGLRFLAHEYTVEMGFDKRVPSHTHAADRVQSRSGGGLGYDDFSAGVGPRVAPQSSRQAVPARGDGTRSPAPGSGRTARPGVTNAVFGSSAPRFAGSDGVHGSTPRRAASRTLRHQRHHHRLPRFAEEDPAWGGGRAASSSPFRAEAESGFYYPTGRRHPNAAGTSNALYGRSPTGPVHGSSVGGGHASGFSVRPASPAAASPGAGAGGGGRGEPPSMITSVTYTVAGTFPNAPPPPATDYSAGPNELRVALSPPAIASSDDDVVVTAGVHVEQPVTLCWWLAYGPSNIVLNLDKLYANGAVTTFQVSENAVVLSIRGGTLVPGWEYAVHLDVTDPASGRSTAAQTQFTLPGQRGQASAAPGSHVVGNGSGSAAAAPPGIGSAADVESRRQAYLREKRAAGSWYAAGYNADGERGTLSGQAPKGQVQDASPAAGTVTSAQKVPQSPAGHATPPRQTMSSASSPAPRVVSSSVAGGAPSGIQLGESAAGQQQEFQPRGTFQEQLREFFVRQVEPLYYLSANPSLSEQAFKEAVRGVSRDFWFARPADSELDDDLRREIVRAVKVAVAKARGGASDAVTNTR